MEEDVFTLPNVGQVLEQNYIEARIHTDDFQNPERNDRNKELKLDMTESYTTPIYLLVDPETNEILKRRDGALFDIDAFIDFLEAPLAP